MNRTVVITGASSGIGLFLKQQFSQLGDSVISLDLNNQTNGSTEFKCDVSNAEQVKQIFNVIKEQNKSIDILINCAGYAVFGATELVDEKKAKAMFDVNYFGTLYTIQNALDIMPKGSKIINISSACAFFALPFRTHYCASKAAVSMLSYGLRMELKSSKVDVCAICPGDIKTNFSKNRVKTFDTNDRYGNRIEKSANQIEERENQRMSVNYAASKIFKICNKKHFKPMYIIGKQYKFLYFLQKVFCLKSVLNYTNKHF